MQFDVRFLFQPTSDKSDKVEIKVELITSCRAFVAFAVFRIVVLNLFGSCIYWSLRVLRHCRGTGE